MWRRREQLTARLFLAAAVGVVTGIMLGRSAVFSDVFGPLTELARPIPAIAMVPVALSPRDLNREGLTCVLVEQNVAVSLKLAARAYVLENGRVTLSGAGAELLADDRVRQAYLGM